MNCCLCHVASTRTTNDDSGIVVDDMPNKCTKSKPWWTNTHAAAVATAGAAAPTARVWAPWKTQRNREVSAKGHIKPIMAGVREYSSPTHGAIYKGQLKTRWCLRHIGFIPGSCWSTATLCCEYHSHRFEFRSRVSNVIIFYEVLNKFSIKVNWNMRHR